MKQYDFTLGFSIMANDELDARVKLSDLLKAIDKGEILKAMRLEDPDELTKHDASELLDALDKLTDSVEQNVSPDFSADVNDDLWTDFGAAIDVLRFYGRRDPPNILGRFK